MADADGSSVGRRRPRVVDARQHRGARSRLRCRGKKSEGNQCLGRSRGGYSTKLHAVANGLGNPLRFALTAGQAGDAPEAIPLLGTVSMIAVQAVLADRAPHPRLEQRRHPRLDQKPGCRGRHPTPSVQQRHPQDRLVPVQRARGDRVSVRQAEALPPRLQPLRQARLSLSRLRASRRRSHPVAAECQQGLVNI